ncbi:MAG: MBL fold metallo-hydrolase [Lentisphaerae bacterium]|nr:MBL fold metallo-hydrolase [Lentisphaerota bacterium]
MKPKSTVRLHIIGSGCPDPKANRYGSAFLLELDGHGILIDCGPATTYKMARMGLDPRQVRHMFFTHHHFDHNADFPCFALTRWDQSRGHEGPLMVYGPPPTKAFTEELLGKRGAFAIDWQSRREHPASLACHMARGGVPAPAATGHPR